MVAVYPGAVANLSNPAPGTFMDAAGFEHDVQHANANDEIEAIENELGVNPSAAYATVVARLAAMDTATVAAAPPGVINPYGGFTAPSGWLLCDGSAVSRATYSALFAAITIAATGNTTSGSASIASVTNQTNMKAGMYISGPGVPAGTTILTVGAGTLTLSANATATATGVALVISPYGIGDGSTTFNTPDLRGRVTLAPDDMGGTDAGRLSSSNTLGTAGGSEGTVLTTAQLPSHAHSIDHDHGAFTSGGGSSHGHGHTMSIDGADTNHYHGLGGHTHGITVYDNYTTHGHSVGLQYATTTGTGGTGMRVTDVNGATGGGGSSTSFGVPASGITHGHSAGSGGPSTTSDWQATTSWHGHGISGGVSAESGHTHSIDVPNFTGTSGSIGSGSSVSNMQPFLTVNAIIKT